jgi:hypothetical protein
MRMTYPCDFGQMGFSGNQTRRPGLKAEAAAPQVWNAFRHEMTKMRPTVTNRFTGLQNASGYARQVTQNQRIATRDNPRLHDGQRVYNALCVPAGKNCAAPSPEIRQTTDLTGQS